MARLPDGTMMPTAEFMQRYGADLANAPDAEFGVFVPPYDPNTDREQHSIRVMIGTAVGVVLLPETPGIGGIIGAGIGDYLASGPQPGRTIGIRLHDLKRGD